MTEYNIVMSNKADEELAHLESNHARQPNGEPLIPAIGVTDAERFISYLFKKNLRKRPFKTR